MKDIINEISVLIENTGYSINKNDIDIEQLKNINSRLKEIRSKLNLLTIPIVVGQSEQLKAFVDGFDVWFKERGDKIIIMQDLRDYLESL